MLTKLVRASDQERIKRFVNVFVERCTDVAVAVPDAMRNGPTDGEGWTPWKPVNSPIVDDDILAFESEIGVSFPPLFRAYLMHKCLLMTEFAVVLPETPSDDPLGRLRQYLTLWQTEPFFRNHKLLPFAYDAEGAGPVCFDIAHRRDDGDYPVVRVDQGGMQAESYCGERIAGSFSELLDNIENELLSYG